MAYDDQDTDDTGGGPGQDSISLNDHYHRLVAAVAMAHGGQPPAGVMAGSPPGSPGIGPPGGDMSGMQPQMQLGGQMGGQPQTMGGMMPQQTPFSGDPNPLPSGRWPGMQGGQQPSQMPTTAPPQGASDQVIPWDDMAGPGRGQPSSLPRPMAQPQGGQPDPNQKPDWYNPDTTSARLGHMLPGGAWQSGTQQQPGDLNTMGQPYPPPRPLDTFAGPQGHEYHTPTPAWQTPQPGGQQSGAPQNPNPGQPFAGYQVGKQPPMVQPPQGGQPYPSQDRLRPAEPGQSYVGVGERIRREDAQQQGGQQQDGQPYMPHGGQLPSESSMPAPPTYQPWTPALVAKEIRRVNPGITEDGVRAKMAWATETLEKQNQQHYHLATQNYKNQMEFYRANRQEGRADETAQHHMATEDATQQRLDRGEARDAHKEMMDEANQAKAEMQSAQTGMIHLQNSGANRTKEGKPLYEQLQKQQADAEKRLRKAQAKLKKNSPSNDDEGDDDLQNALPQSGAGPGPSGEPAKITNDDDYKKLPPGAHFVGPDGKIRTKPGK
jgi:hypothetical protein